MGAAEEISWWWQGGVGRGGAEVLTCGEDGEQLIGDSKKSDFLWNTLIEFLC